MRARMQRWLGVDAVLVEHAELKRRLAAVEAENKALKGLLPVLRAGLAEHKCWVEALIRLVVERGSARERRLHALFGERVEAWRQERAAAAPEQVNGTGTDG